MASGDTLARFDAHGWEPPASNAAALVIRNGHLLLAFDKDTDESAIWAFNVPRNYAGGGISVVIGWCAPAATTGTARWQGSFERNQEDVDDLDSDSFAAAQSAGEATASAAGELQYTEIVFTDGAQIDSIAVGEAFRFKLNRDADGTTGTDDLAEDAQVRFVELRET